MNPIEHGKHEHREIRHVVGWIYERAGKRALLATSISYVADVGYITAAIATGNGVQLVSAIDYGGDMIDLGEVMLDSDDTYCLSESLRYLRRIQADRASRD